MIGFGQAKGRAERLLSLSCMLSLGRPLKLAEIRDRFGLYTDGDDDSTRRQFERDKKDLRDLGVEVETVQLMGEDAYRIPSRLPSIAINWTEEEALALASLAAAVGDEVTGGALAKTSVLTDAFPAEHTRAKIRVDLDVPPALTDAHARRRCVRFTYRNAKGEVAERTVEPWAIASRRHQTYVTGFDLDRDEGRAFRIDRIQSDVEDAGEATHERPESGLGVPLAPQERSTVRLHVADTQVPDALAMGAEIIGPVDDAGQVVEVELAEVRDESAIGWALRHQAEVVSPASIAGEVARRRQLIIERHSGEPTLEPLKVPTRTKRPRRAGLSNQRLARLLALPEWLAARPGVTAEEIATAFGCSVMEIRGELELLDWLDVPKLGLLGNLTVHADGQLEFNAQLHSPRAELTTVEAVHLLSLVEAALALLPSADTPALESVAGRLRDMLPEGVGAVQWTELSSPVLEAVRDVVGTGQVVGFSYHGRRDEQAEARRVRPLQLQLTGGAVYLAGIDVEEGQARVFRIDRISDVTVESPMPPAAAGETAAPTPMMAQPTYVPSDDEVAVELLLSPKAVWILRLTEPTLTEDRADGSVHALIHTDVPSWLLSHVRAAGGEAELLGPPTVRAAALAKGHV